jgi:hypothetical protein
MVIHLFSPSTLIPAASLGVSHFNALCIHCSRERLGGLLGSGCPLALKVASIVYNNKMERMNGEIRQREKVMRSLKTTDTPIVSGYQIYHNFIRPHMGLKGKTPAELAGIEVQGENKWLTLIQNASVTHAKKRDWTVERDTLCQN